jgi:hypothetical protein
VPRKPDDRQPEFDLNGGSAQAPPRATPACETTQRQAICAAALRTQGAAPASTLETLATAARAQHPASPEPDAA